MKKITKKSMIPTKNCLQSIKNLSQKTEVLCVVGNSDFGHEMLYSMHQLWEMPHLPFSARRFIYVHKHKNKKINKNFINQLPKL